MVTSAGETASVCVPVRDEGMEQRDERDERDVGLLRYALTHRTACVRLSQTQLHTHRLDTQVHLFSAHINTYVYISILEKHTHSCVL